jgi:hypothetical protein
MRRPVVASCLAGLALVALSACSGSNRGPEAFCSRLQRERDKLVTGVVDPKTAQSAVDGYKALDGLAPEAIRTEWHQLALLVESASELDPTATTAQEALVQQAYSAAPAAETVTAYARQTCGVDLSAPTATTTPAVTTGPTTTAPASATPPPSG